MWNFASTEQFTFAFVVSIINALVLCLAAYKLFHIFQLGGYRYRGYLKWLVDRRFSYYTRLLVLALLSFGSMFTFNLIFDSFTDIVYLSYLGLIFYFTLAIVFIVHMVRRPTKIPLKFTYRLRRLYVLFFVICLVLSFTALWIGSTELGRIRFSLISVIPLFLPVILVICDLILWPVEAGVRAWYISRAKRKLRRPEYANLVRIGITGSYGKTSTKNILATILEQRFRTAKSPSSFNTPLGFSKTVNNILRPEHEVIIFEMGLRYRRDIRTLARLFGPKHGILTAIGSQHIETMKTLENIKNEKAELVRALPPDGIAVLNGDSEKCVEVHDELPLENKVLTRLDESISDLEITQEGSSFTLSLGEDSVRCTTKLLGKHNIQNTLMAATLAHKLGMTPSEIAEGIAELRCTPHRLELVTAPNGILVLDDSYNASEQGTIAALEVLQLFKGKKVVQTPGIVEQGTQSTEVNFKLGLRIAKMADEVIIVNEQNRAPLSDGLKYAGFEAEKIHFYKTSEEAKSIYSTILAASDVLLLMNDLPDNFS